MAAALIRCYLRTATTRTACMSCSQRRLSRRRHAMPSNSGTAFVAAALVATRSPSWLEDDLLKAWLWCQQKAATVTCLCHRRQRPTMWC